MPIEELGKVLDFAQQADLGKHSSSLIARMMSTKMPAAFNVAAAKAHLEARWGLGPERQKAVMLVALADQPKSRLASDEEAKVFFDNAAKTYSSQVGIDLTPKKDHASQDGDRLIDSAALEEFTSEQRKLSVRQLELLAAHLKLDLREPARALVDSQIAQEARQAQIDLWNIEHGEAYSNGIIPTFNPLKVRFFDSYWNWVRDDILCLYYNATLSNPEAFRTELALLKQRIINRASTSVVQLLRYLFDRPTRDLIDLTDLIDACERAIKVAPVFKGSFVSSAPQTTVDGRGTVRYCEIPRDAELTVQEYCRAMNCRISEFEQEYNVVTLRQQYDRKGNFDIDIDLLGSDAIMCVPLDNIGLVTPPEEDVAVVIGGTTRSPSRNRLPFLHLKQQKGHRWDYNAEHTRIYMNSLNGAAASGVTFNHKTVLVTGSGAGSIGAMILEGLLDGGATVIATTSSFSQEVAHYYQNIYTAHGARGSRLIILPFNQSSKQDVESLVKYIYSSNKGLGLDLDHVLPFAAVSEGDNEIDNIDSRSELAHRMMMTNLIRLLGNIKRQKEARGYLTRPSQVILPLSPNHGTFGADGLYSESKIALETLFNKWGSERWGSFLTLCGANIGWTRGTGLMNTNDTIAEGIEKLGVRTFSQKEMAFNILALMTPAITELCETEPVYADLTGSLNSISELKSVTMELRNEINECSERRKLLAREQVRESVIERGVSHQNYVRVEPRANLDFQFAPLPDYKTEILPIGNTLKGTVNLDKVVVVTGFSELGPVGNSRTRWELEAHGRLSLEGCVEMAWIMGLIKHHYGPIKGRQAHYSGWINSKTSDPMSDQEIKVTFEKHILAHSGIRIVETDLLAGRDNRLMQEVIVQEDLAPFETSKDQALSFQKQHGDKAEAIPIAGTDEYQVRIKSGAIIMVPRAIPYDHLVAAQVPKGWDARHYGIPEDIIAQVDKVTLYVLVCTAEALLSAGVTDPYEFYQYVHVSEVANCIGSGMGGGDSLRSIYKERTLDKSVQNDILQETFINTISAWVNMLLLSSSGPIKTSVGACATALESVNIGYDTIITGQARICFVGGCDSFNEEIAAEFANMKATNDPKADETRGRVPKEMSRPNSSTRNGFVESEGCGIQILTTAKLALDMGLPIYGIVALATTASDKIGRSVPAPGQGILVNAREESKGKLLAYEMDQRRSQLQFQLDNASKWEHQASQNLARSLGTPRTDDEKLDTFNNLQSQVEEISRRANYFREEARNNVFWRQDPHISPLRGALATWGLNIDDLGVASLHGTSTAANDKNESDIICKQLRHLGRQEGNPVLAITQKYLTGHPKGAAGAWMLNGAFQVLNTGLVPGNRNLDNVDKNFERFDLMHYPGKSVQTDGVKAFSATSFGFGQKSAQVVGVHARYLFASLDEDTYESYKAKAQARQQVAYREWHSRMISNSIFQAKAKPPYNPEVETQTLLDPNARAGLDNHIAEYTISAKPAEKRFARNRVKEDGCKDIIDKLVCNSKSTNIKTGVDIEDIASISISPSFIMCNFTEAEEKHCRAASNPQASFSGRWSAKKAVSKCLGVAGKGAGASMREIEITDNEYGAPMVKVSANSVIIVLLIQSMLIVCTAPWRRQRERN